MSLACQTNHTVSLTDLQRVLPETPLYGTNLQTAGSNVGWLLSPSPYIISPDKLSHLKQIGVALHQLAKATEALYRLSVKNAEYSWLQTLFHAGKPQHLIQYSQMKRFKNQFPLVIRPDLLVTEQGFSLCEVDAVPGGIGFTGALHQAYHQLGFTLAGKAEGVPNAFLEMLRHAVPDKSEPMVAVVVSDEASDYRQELQWLVDSIHKDYPRIVLIHPRDITLAHNQLGFTDTQGNFEAIDLIYRFFELFDLPNIPQIELIQYAVKKGIVSCTPPFKPYLEEKLILALIHMPSLEVFWSEHLGETTLKLLKALIPESWILDPAVIPPHAQVVPTLVFQNRHLRDFTGLDDLTQKQRELVIKPSGFSPLAWGSRGVKVGHDLPQTEWQNALHSAFQNFSETPYLLQRFAHTKVEPYSYFHSDTGDTISGEGRTRLCPYFFIKDDTPELVSILATTCPKDKKVIHGMRDGVMRPVMVV